MKKKKIKTVVVKNERHVILEINKRFYGICAIKKCTNPNFKAWYIEMLIPGGHLDHLELCNPVTSLSQAKENASKIVETVISDFKSIVS